MSFEPLVPGKLVVLLGIVFWAALFVIGILTADNGPRCWHDGCDREGVKAVRVCREHHKERKR